MLAPLIQLFGELLSFIWGGVKVALLALLVIIVIVTVIRTLLFNGGKVKEIPGRILVNITRPISYVADVLFTLGLLKLGNTAMDFFTLRAFFNRRNRR